MLQRDGGLRLEQRAGDVHASHLMLQDSPAPGSAREHCRYHREHREEASLPCEDEGEAPASSHLYLTLSLRTQRHISTELDRTITTLVSPADKTGFKLFLFCCSVSLENIHLAPHRDLIIIIKKSLYTAIHSLPHLFLKLIRDPDLRTAWGFIWYEELWLLIGA